MVNICFIMAKLPVISLIHMYVLKKSYFITTSELIWNIFNPGTLTTVAFFIEVAIMMMFMDIWPSYLSLGLVDDLFQPFIMYGDGYKYI